MSDDRAAIDRKSWWELLRSWSDSLPDGAKAFTALFSAIAALITAIQPLGLLSAPAAPPRIPLAAIQSGLSIAARPFVNLSADPSDRSLSLGMAIAIDNALSGARNLRVVGHSSNLPFGSRNEDTLEAAKQLGLTHMIEGSVQRDRDKVFVSANLVKVEDGTRLWSNTYELSFTNNLEDALCTPKVADGDELSFTSNLDLEKRMAQTISKAAATQLKVPFRERNFDISKEISDKYRKAEVLFTNRKLDDAIGKLAAITRSPCGQNFIPAWEMLAQARRLQLTYSPDARKSTHQAIGHMKTLVGEAKTAADELIGRDADNAIGYAMRAAVMARSGNWPAAEDDGKRAFRLSPNDPVVLHDFSQLLTIVGHFKEALEKRENLRKLEPDNTVYNLVTADILQVNGGRRESIRILERMPADGPQSYFRNVFLARAYAAEGRYRAAADTLRLIKSDQQVTRRAVEDAAQLLRQAPKKVPLPSRDLMGELDFVYLYIGAPPEIILANTARYIGQRNMTMTGMRALWLPEFRAVRKSRAFKELIKEAHIDDYWRQRGWPDLCRPQGNDDFVCDWNATDGLVDMVRTIFPAPSRENA
jgi:TolB-like protein/tetratricopeptide (TPR) repeat protein